VATVSDVLKQSDFGERVAEEESSELEGYFVETEQWQAVLRGQADIIYGAKGAGKSAVYSLLNRRAKELSCRGIRTVSAEKPSGAPVFKGLQQDPPTSEDEFVGLWKLYFLSLIASALSPGRKNSKANRLRKSLTAAGVYAKQVNLSERLQMAFDYVKRVFREGTVAVEAGMSIDSVSAVPAGVSAKIVFSPGSARPRDGVYHVDDLLHLANDALEHEGVRLWILLDRLDVAFAESHELEENALRALFRVYLDILALERIVPKIFLRTDIWSRIARRGFREASHITRTITIEWTPEALLNLIVKRALKNAPVVGYLGVDVGGVLESFERQREVFYRIFPQQVDIGERKPNTLDWMLTRVADGSKRTAPREIIHLLNSAREERLREHELGASATNLLFSRSALKASLPAVSRTRLHQTLLAEYPNLRVHIEGLRGQKTEQTPDTLAGVWSVSREEAIQTAAMLVEAGFFEERGTVAEPVYWVPFLYRDAAGMVQGAAPKMM